jgi:hypothetical protein
MSIVLHTLAFILWLGVVFFAVGVGATSEKNDPNGKTVAVAAAIAILLFAVAFTLQVIA